MLNFLFGGLTAEGAQGAPLFDAATRLARQPHWYVAGKVPDTLEGRFAMVATIIALAMLRLEKLGEPGNRLSVQLTERFVEVMEAEHRELGLGDPTLGKTVRKLVGALARRVDIWRGAIAGDRDWNGAAAASLPDRADALHCAESLRALWDRLASAGVEQLAEGGLQ